MNAKLLVLTLVVLGIGCSKPTAEEMFKNGENAQKVEQYDEAIAAYQDLIQAYPDSVRTPEAYYALGTIYQNYKNDQHKALQFYHELVQKYPHHATSSNAAFVIGFIYNNELKQFDSARVAYAYFLEHYPNDPLAPSARFEIANLGKDPVAVLSSQAQQAKDSHAAKKQKKK